MSSRRFEHHGLFFVSSAPYCSKLWPSILMEFTFKQKVGRTERSAVPAFSGHFFGQSHCRSGVAALLDPAYILLTLLSDLRRCFVLSYAFGYGTSPINAIPIGPAI